MEGNQEQQVKENPDNMSSIGIKRAYNDSSEGSSFQIVLWLPKTSVFKPIVRLAPPARSRMVKVRVSAMTKEDPQDCEYST